LVGALQKAVAAGRTPLVAQRSGASPEALAEAARLDDDAAKADLEAKRKVAEKAAKEEQKQAAVAQRPPSPPSPR
jgi:hypothetical protein